MLLQIHTSQHRISANRYMTTVSEEWLGRYWWTLALPVAACLAIGTLINVAFTFVAFMLLCLVLPFIMMMLYFNYALTPEATMAVRPHTISMDPEKGIDVNFRPDPETGKEFKPVHLDWSEVSEVETRSSDVVLKFHRRNYRYVIIPYFALNDDPELVQRLHDLLASTGKLKVSSLTEIK